MSKEKKVAKAKSAKPAKAKSESSVVKIVRAKLSAGVTNPETILEAIRKDNPKSKATPGYVRHIARHIVGKPLPTGRGEKAKAKSKPKAAKPKAAKPKAEAKTDAESQSQL